MNKIYRWMSILLCLCIMCTALPGDFLIAAAEEGETVIEETAEPQLELGESSDEETQDEAVPAPTEETPVYTYAKLLTDAALYASATDETALATLPADSLVLIVEVNEDGNGRAQVAFANQNAVWTGWMDATALSELTADETAAFQDGVTEALCYQDDASWPLPEVSVKQDAEPTAVPETTVEPEQELTVYEETTEETEVASAIMTLSEAAADLKVGETAEIEAIFSDGEARSVRYALTASGVVSVDNSGVVTAVGAGMVDVQVICDALNQKCTFSVTVTEAQPARAPKAAQTLQLMVGETGTISGVDATGTVQYVSDNEGVAKIVDGIVTAVGAGTCTVTATQDDGTVVTCNVTVYALPDKLEAALTSEMDVGDTADITLNLDEYFLSKVTYTSSAPAVAAVSSNGAVTAVSGGECTITVKLGDLTQTLPLLVYGEVKSFEAEIDKDELKAGETASVTVTYPEYTRGTTVFSSGDETIATVDDQGVVTAKSKGKCSIYVAVGNVMKALTVEVWALPSDFEMTLEESSLAIGYSTWAKVEFEDYTTADVTFSSSNPGVASVDAQTGRITALSEGECMISAVANGICKNCKFKVITAAVNMVDKYLTLSVGATYELQYNVSDMSMAFLSKTITSSDATVATVDSDTCIVTAKGVGEAVLTLTLSNGETAKCYLTVNPAPTTVVVSNAVKTMGVGQITDAMDVKLYAGNELTTGDVSFKSSNTKVVQVNAYGQMKAVKAGSANITVTSYNGRTTTFAVTVKAAPKSLTLNVTKASLAVGQQGKINYSLTKNTAAGVTYTSGNTAVATVDQSGNVVAVGVGTCIITVKTHNNLQKTCTITVYKAPENVTLTLSSDKLGVGMTATAKAAVDTSSSVSFAYEYWTDQPEVISVDKSTGKITALTMGEANVYVKTYNGVTTHAEDNKKVETVAKVKVVPAPDKVSFDESSYSVMLGYSAVLPVTMTTGSGSTDCMTSYTLTSSNAKIVKIVSGTKVQGVKAGTATVTVKTSNGLTASVKVTVVAKPTKVLLEHTSLNLGEGMTTQLRAKYYSNKKWYMYSESTIGIGGFTSSDTSVVTVDALGNITGVKKGTATVTFKTLNGKSQSCTVTVMTKPTEIHLNTKEVKLGVGMTSTLEATFGLFEMGDVVYTSSDESIAKVDANGKITAVAQGTATITATTQGTLTDTCKVTVLPGPEKLPQNGETFTVMVGTSYALPVEMTMNDGSTDCMSTYTLTSANTKIAKIVSGTKVQGVKAGTTNIAIKTANGLTAVVKITVVAKPTKVALEHTSLNIGEGMTTQLRAKYYSNKKWYLYSENAGGIGGFTSSDTSIVTVDEAGNITGVKKGTATVTFRTLNGKSQSCTVTVMTKPTEIHLNTKEVKLGVGMSSTLEASFGLFEMGDVVYTSSDENIAKVDANGKITAVAQGTATITATTQGTLTDTCTVKVVPAPEKLPQNGEMFTVMVGTSFTLPVDMTMNDGNTDCMTTYTLTSASTKIAKIVSGTKVQGVKAGTTNIGIKTANGLTAVVKVTVVAKPTKVALEYSSLNTGVGMTTQLRAKYYSNKKWYLYSENAAGGIGGFTSSDTSVVTVDEAGNITGVKKGTATVTFKTANGLTASCLVSVLGTPTALYLEDNTITLGAAMTHQTKVTFNANEMGALSYAISDPSVATVDANGKITGVSKGETTMRITCGNLSIQCRIVVKDAPSSIVLSQTAANMAIKGSMTLSAACVYPSSETGMATLTYKSSNTAVATVTQDGVVKAVKAGNAVITVTAQNGVSASCKIIVQKAPTKIALTSTDVRFGVGQTKIVTGTVTYSGGKATVSSADSSYVRVQILDTSIATYDPATGLITGHEVGKTKYRLYTYNGKYSSYGYIVIQPGADWIAFDEIMVNLGVGETRTVGCDKSAGSVTSYTFVSSNSDIASVKTSGDGCVITAKAAGTVTITATSSNGKTATCQVNVMEAPESLAFASGKVTVGMGETAQLPELNVASTKGECLQKVTYTSSNTSVATVDGAGYVQGQSAGTATITAKTYNGLNAACTVTVEAAPTQITLSASGTVLAVGDTLKLTAEMDNAGAYTFSVADPAVLQVSSDGTVTGLAVGTTTVTVETYNHCTASCTLTVKSVPTSVQLSNENLTLGEGLTGKIQASIDADSYAVLNYTSLDETVAKVSSDGTVTAQKAGTAEIRVSVQGHDNVFDTCTVTVLPLATKVTLNKSTLTLRKGDTAALKATLSASSGEACYGEVKFASSDDSIASVDANGKITALKAGEVSVTATASGSQVQASCTVTVIESDVALAPQNLELGVGETAELSIIVPDNASGWTLQSSDTDVAAVTAKGVVTAIAEGEATLTLTCGDETAQCTVTVGAKPESIELSVSEKTLSVGKTLSLNTALKPEGAVAKLSYASSDEAAATVSADGIVTAVGSGSAVITVSAYDGSIAASCKVTVVYAPEMIRFGELDDIVLTEGDRYVLETPVMFNANGECDASYTLSISNSSCAKITMEDGQYVICGLKEGSATLRLKTDNGKTATHSVYVTAEPTSIAFDDASIRMGVGETYRPVVRGKDTEAVMSVTLSSSNEQVVRVNPDGKIEAVAEGSATLTATSKIDSKLSARVTVHVFKAPESMSLNATALTLGEGEGFELDPVFDANSGSASVTFASNNENVLYADAQGYVYAVGVGKATVTAVSYNGLTASCEVTVKSAPTSISVQPSQITACLTDSVQLNVSFANDDEYANLLYESGDPNVAQVSDNGLVTFKSIGETVITVEAFNGLSVEIPVKVAQTPTQVSFEQNSMVILTKDSAQLPVKFDNGAAYYTLTSSDPSILRIASDGSVEALKTGKVTVVLLVPSLNLSASCIVEVVDKLDGVVLTAEKTTLELHETTRLSYQLLPSNAIGTGLVRFSTSDSAVAEVDEETGLVTGVSYGTVPLYVTTGDGKIGECKINVLGGKRRMLAASYYGEDGDAGYLPFSVNNAASMADAFAGMTVEGQDYDVYGPMSDAPKSQLFAAIDSHFADATDDDISVIYICAHGYAAGPTGDYAFGLDPSHYVTASELMNHLEKIKGKVVLILDSCHSGGMIDANKSRLDAQNGRISILASSHAETSSSYLTATSTAQSVEFYTFSVLRGFGYNSSTNYGNRGWTLTSAFADKDGNGDVTASELFSYAQTMTMSMVATYKNNKYFAGSAGQTPQSYLGNNADLVLFSSDSDLF